MNIWTDFRKSHTMEYEVIRSDRKTVGIQVDEDGKVIIRAPSAMSDREIENVVRENGDWIVRHQEMMKERWESVSVIPHLNADEIKELAGRALEYIPGRVRYFAPIVGVDYGRITIRNQRTRWGSCSAKGNLNFNCLLMMMPPEIIDYVVVHELAHRREMNHSKAFWDIVESVLPDYKERRRWLRENGNRYMRKMTG